MRIHYWRDMLREVGMADAPDKIPMKWDAYWGYWKKAQDERRGLRHLTHRASVSTARCTPRTTSAMRP